MFIFYFKDVPVGNTSILITYADSHNTTLTAVLQLDEISAMAMKADAWSSPMEIAGSMLTLVLTGSLVANGALAFGGPSFAIRVTQHGLEGVKKSIEPIIRHTIQRFRIDDVYDASVLGQGLTVSNLRVQSFTQTKPIDVRLSRSDGAQVVIDVSGVQLAVAVDARFGLLLFQYTTLYMELRDFRLGAGIQLKPSQTHLLSAAVSSCQVAIGQMDVDIGQLKLQNLLFATALPLLKPIIKKLTRQTFCSALMTKVNPAIAQFIHQLPTSFQTAHPQKYVGIYDPMTRLRNSKDYHNVIERLGRIVNGIRFEFALMHKPNVVTLGQQSYLEALVSVQMSHGTHGPPPFQVDLLQPSQIPTNFNKMINLAVSQYVINALFFYVHRAGGMHLRISGRESSSLKDLLRPKCDDLSCIGLVIPESLTEGHESEYGELELNFVKCPWVRVDRGGIRVYLDGTQIDYRLEGQTNSLVTFTVSSTGTLQLQIRGRTFLGELTITDVKVATGKNVSIDDFLLELVGDVLKGVIQNEINGILQLGIPIPEIELASFNSFVLRTVRNAMVYDFNLDLHNSKLQELIKEFFIH